MPTNAVYNFIEFVVDYVYSIVEGIRESRHTARRKKILGWNGPYTGG